MPKLSIASGQEWQQMLNLLREQLDGMREVVFTAARNEAKVAQRMGQYDGYHAAIEYLQSLGKDT